MIETSAKETGAAPAAAGTVTPRVIYGAAIIVAAVWTAAIALVVAANHQFELQAAQDAATVAARSQFVKDVVYRRWNAGLGGVYADISTGIEPNPYLTQVEEREVTTTSGRRLTLVNPAYMTRGVHELGYETEGVIGHITSLDPIRPANAPDDWETAALESFDDAGDEVSQISTIRGRPFLRFMRPLITEEGCLQCHAQQGYRIGDIRGGISVAVPMDAYMDIARRNSRSALAGYSALWALGLIGIVLGARSISSRARRQLAAEGRVQHLLREREMLLREVQHRIKNNMNTMASILWLRAVNATDPASRRVLEEISGRFSTMMTVYEKLYRSERAHTLSLKSYVQEVVEDIVEASRISTVVTVETEIEDVSLDPNTTSALGILTAEAVTNSLKYAFPDRKSGTVTIAAAITDGRMTYRVVDDGVGIGEHYEHGLGMQVMDAVANQIGGTVAMTHAPGPGTGTEVRVAFPLPDDADTTVGAPEN